MSNLIDFAKHELDLIGMTEEGDPYNVSMRKHLLHMIEEFSKEGHSGFSANYAISCLEKLLNFKPLTPLTGEDDEWVKLEYNNDMAYQNKRCSNVFKRADGTAYDIDGKLFWEWRTDGIDEQPYKSYYTNKDSIVDITFPYVPRVEYVERELEAE